MGRRDCRQSSKCKGGDIAVLIKDIWSNPGHVTVNEDLIELLISICKTVRFACVILVEVCLH